MAEKIVNVLHVEDDMIDVRLLRRIFAKYGILNPLHRAADAIEALEILRGENGRARVEEPYVILLDMKLPRMDGIEFLRELRADPQLKDTIVFMLTTFMRDEEKAAAIRHAVAGVILKGEIAEDDSKLVELLEEYWRVPPGGSSPSKLLHLSRR